MLSLFFISKNQDQRLYEEQNILPDQDQLSFIQLMLWNGLNIGFLAEFRAWLFVLQKAKLFQFLDSRFVDQNPSIPWL